MKKLAIALAVGAFAGLALTFLGIAIIVVRTLLPVSPRGAEDLATKRQEVAEAIRGEGLDADPATRAAIQATFEGLADEIHRRDIGAVSTRFDGERMMQEVERLLPPGSFGLVPRGSMATGVLAGLGQSLVNNPAMQWSRTELRSVRPGEHWNEVVAYVRHDVPDGGAKLKMRWWLILRGRKWSVFDFEDLDGGMRGTTMMGLFMSEGLRARGLPAWGQAMKDHLAPAIQAVARGEIAEAEKHLDRLRGIDSPAQVQGLTHMMRGACLLQKYEAESALKELATAESHNSDLPIVHLLRSTAYNLLDRREDAIASGRKYVELLGPDPIACENIGTALAALGRDDEAADVYRKALDDTPDNPEVLHALREVLPVGKRGEIAGRFMRLSDPAGQFDDFAGRLLADEDHPSVTAIADALVAAGRDVPAVGCFRAIAKVSAGNPTTGAADFRTAIASASADKRALYVSRFLNAMMEAGKPLEGYAAAPDPDEAFRHLADIMLDDDDQETAVPKLIKAHRDRRPDDPWLHFYQGLMHERHKEFNEADTEYAAGAAQVTADEDRERFRSARVAARVEAGTGLSAYKEIGPPKATFDQLAWAFSDRKAVQDLEHLVQAHRRALPDDKDLILWQAEIHWLRQQHAELVSFLRPRHGAIPQENSWRYTDRVVRSLVRLNRFEEAKSELVRVPAEQRRLNHTVLIAAAAGDVAGVEAEFAKFADKPYMVEWLYFDEDLGPILRSDRFKELRKKFPEPPIKPGKNAA